LKFNHNQSYDCEEHNACENQGKCFRDRPTCPTSFLCDCDDCSYGSRCEFSTKGSGFSLDAILGYYIQPNRTFTEQYSSIHATTVIITLMLIVGILSNLFSIFTFQTKKAREVGCGYYLLVSSYSSAITIIMFALKFYFLLASQMGTITNRNYLTFNCIFIEYVLKVLLSAGDWLSAWVGIERAITAMKDTTFNKTKGKRIAKWIITFTYIIIGATYIHDPVYRRLVDDDQEHRTWCHVQFNSSFQLFNSIILGLHVILPFVSNIISAVLIIIVTARQRFIAQKNQQYTSQLQKQIKELKHLLISPIILIILASPRLIITILSGCMKTTRGYLWLYLTGYLVSFLPSMLIILVFVLPSKTYKNELNKTIARIRKSIRCDHV
jgi:hypothetical protein